MSTVIKNSIFSLIGNLFKLVITIIGMAWLGRILGPVVFGEYAVVHGLHAIFLPFLNIGLSPAYYKTSINDENASNSFFTLQNILALVVCLIFLLLAYPASVYYKSSNIFELLLVHSFTLVFIGLSLQPYSELSRNNKYSIIATVQTISLFISFLIAVLLAKHGFGVWTLSAKLLISSTVTCGAYLFFAGKKYRLVGYSSLVKYRSLFFFAGYLGLSRIVSGFSDGLDKLLFGYLFGKEPLGNYDRSYQLASYPDNIIRTSLTNPILSHTANLSSAQDSYVVIVKAFYVAAGLPCVSFMAYGDQIIELLLGSNWIFAGEMLKWLGFLGLAKVVRGTYLVLEINEGNGKALISKSIYSSIFILTALLIGLFISFTINTFVITYSCAWLFYWCVSIMYFVFLKKGKRACIEIVKFYTVTATLLYLSCLLSKVILVGYIDSIIVILTCQLILAVFFFIPVVAVIFPKDYMKAKSRLAIIVKEKLK